MGRFLAAGKALLCLTLLVSGNLARAADPSQPVPELLQYIRDARKLGFKDAEIKARAMEAGWPEAAVEQAIGALTPAKKPETPSRRPARTEPAAEPARKSPPPSAAPAAAPRQTPVAVAAPAHQPSPDLIQYVKDARNLGLPDAEIKANAMTAGWAEPMVDAAVRSLKPAAAAAAAGTQQTGGSAAAPPAQEPGVPYDYQIGAGDTLDIRVWKEPDASVGVVVRPDGKITLPLLKELSVVGLTPTEVERIVSTRLSEFIRGANVTVVVTGINSKKIYIVGAVKKEGPVPLNYRMSVLQALSEAGGLTDYAKRKNIYVLRTQDGKQYRFPFNYEAVIRGEQMEQNIWVAPDDTIVVPH